MYLTLRFRVYTRSLVKVAHRLEEGKTVVSFMKEIDWLQEGIYMELRRFVLNGEPCIIHYPERPNGFAILLLANLHEFLPSQGEHYWQRQETRRKMLDAFLARGYTVYFSNCFGQHMGKEAAFKLARDLYEYVKRTEILNDRIHIIAENLGAKLALRFLENNPEALRSIVFLNPLFSLRWQGELLKEQPFVYQRFLQEVAKAYQCPEEESETLILKEPLFVTVDHCPYKIIHILKNGMYDEKWVRMYQQYLTGQGPALHMLLREKEHDIFPIAQELFVQTEVEL